MSTSAANGVDIRWTLSSDTTCMDGDDITIDTETWNLAVNAPASVRSSWCIPEGTAPGDYNVCATIDYTDEFSETSESDNIVISEGLFTVPFIECLE